MAIIYVTGPTGVGKTTVCRLLRERSYEAFDADYGISYHYDRYGHVVPYPAPNNVTPKWLAEHTYKMSESHLIVLFEKARGRTIFLCGTARNDLAIRRYFNQIICLTTDLPTALARIANRDTSTYGRVAVEEADIRKRYDKDLDKYRDIADAIITTTGVSPQITTDQVLLSAGLAEIEAP